MDITTMPELSNIQTYEKIEGTNFRPTLDRFSRVLKSIDLWNDEIKDAFNNFEWKVEDDGFVYSSISKIRPSLSNLSSITIRPLVMAWTPGIDSSFKDNWISCDLLIATEELARTQDGRFHKQTFNLVKALTSEMQEEFKQTGVYFTDEAQDGSDFNGVRTKVDSKLWQFDYALIPLTLEHMYSTTPLTHRTKRHDDFLESWYKDRWEVEPNR